MTRWEFEPGHTAAEFRARHMMVSWVRGLFKDIHGVVDLDGRDLPEVRVATPEVDLDTSLP